MTDENLEVLKEKLFQIKTEVNTLNQTSNPQLLKLAEMVAHLIENMERTRSNQLMQVSKDKERLIQKDYLDEWKKITQKIHYETLCISDKLHIELKIKNREIEGLFKNKIFLC